MHYMYDHALTVPSMSTVDAFLAIAPPYRHHNHFVSSFGLVARYVTEYNVMYSDEKQCMYCTNLYCWSLPIWILALSLWLWTGQGQSESHDQTDESAVLILAEWA